MKRKVLIEIISRDMKLNKPCYILVLYKIVIFIISLYYYYYYYY